MFLWDFRIYRERFLSLSFLFAYKIKKEVAKDIPSATSKIYFLFI